MEEKKLKQLIIFEGPDCGGKSSLMHELARNMGMSSFEKVHHGPFPRITASQLPRFYVESMFNLFQGGEGLMMDRCWLSEPIYGQAYRDGATRIGHNERRHLERMALRHGAVVVLCLPRWEAVKAKWLERKGADSEAEYLDKIEQLETVYKLYDELEGATDLPVVRYDYTLHAGNTQLNHLKARIQKASTGVHPNAWMRTAGSATPKVVLVGEKPSEPTDRDTGWQFPFCSFGAQGSSLWLTEQLREDGIFEQDLMWINASDSLSVLKDMWRVPVIALGNEAAAAVTKALDRAPDATVPHPQYQKRFKAGQPYPLADEILKLIK